MALELIFLGTGTSTGVPMIGCRCGVCTSADPRDRRTRPSVLVRYPRPGHIAENEPEANGMHDPTAPPAEVQVLVDVTPDIRDQSIREGLAWLDAVVLTHGHADHTMGMDDLRRFNAVMDAPLELYAEPGVLMDLGRSFEYIFGGPSKRTSTFVANLLPFPLENAVPMPLHGATWTPLRLMHGRLPIVGYRVDWEDRSLAYCTDVSTIPPETWPLLADLDVFVVDGLRFRHHPTHMTVDQAVEVCERVGASQSFLTHMSHEVSHAEHEPELPEGVSLAHDGLRVSIGRRGVTVTR